MKVFYHATPLDNIDKLLIDGIKAGPDGLIYMCEEPDESARFLVVRGIKRIGVVEIKIPKRYENNIEETFDHSPIFFKCRAFGYFGNIPSDWVSPDCKFEL